MTRAASWSRKVAGGLRNRGATGGGSDPGSWTDSPDLVITAVGKDVEEHLSALSVRDLEDTGDFGSSGKYVFSSNRSVQARTVAYCDCGMDAASCGMPGSGVCLKSVFNSLFTAFGSSSKVT
jgi:hypothetical protein